MPIIGIWADYLAHRAAHIEDTVARGNAQLLRAGKEPYSIRYFHSAEEVEKGIADCEILYGYFPAGLIKKAENLVWLHAASAGVDVLLSDDVYAHPDKVVLTHSNGSYGITISEYMVMMILMLMRRQIEYNHLQIERTWKNVGQIRSIYGSRVVIVGTGDIGTNLARRLKAMGASKVIGLRRTLKAADPAFDTIGTLEHLEEALQGADVLALCVPATSETNGLLSREIIAKMDPKTFVVNVGRGSAIDQEALTEALKEGRLAGAALDVFTPEPLPKDDPLYDLPNVILTPHVAGNMSLSYTSDLNVDIFCRNLERYFNGEELHHVVDRKLGY
ncbi:MAG: D-2-hydroxyacid dehydrogenase [Firmicutes bacterium]|nr:D-2-hydroxyacid dehydrogenase [Bacillota bacterium]